MNHPAANLTSSTESVQENRRVLCVDDDQNVLDGLERLLFEDFDVQTVPSAVAALELINPQEPFAVIISDMRMPKMDGAEFLKRVRALAPDSVRILLTGQTDLNSAISAINEGHIFRFLCKPCPQETLIQALEAAVKQYRMLTREHEMLESTFMNTIKMFMEALSMETPMAFNRAETIKDYVVFMAHRRGLGNIWIYKMAAMLSQLGCITLPAQTLNRIATGCQLSQNECAMYDDHPLTGARLLARIPRMKEVAAIIRYQRGAPDDAPEITRTGADMLHTALALDQLVVTGMEVQQALNKLRGEGTFKPELLDAMADFRPNEQPGLVKAVKITELTPDMVLNEPVCTRKGAVVLDKGEKLHAVQIARLINFARDTAVMEPVNVCLPAGTYG